MNKLSISFFIILFICSCTPFDSNKVNKKLIQGKWLQTQTTTVDSTSHIITKDIKDSNIFLLFSNDTCIEKINNTITREYKFDIKDYFIKLEEKGYPDNFVIINKLTRDSLLLQRENRILKYTRQIE